MSNSVELPTAPETKLVGESDLSPKGPAPLKPVLCVQELKKAYRKHTLAVPVLHGVNLNVEPGEFVSIVGQSGSGKSTLLHLIGLLDANDSGSIEFEGQRIDNLPTSKRDRLRNEAFGFVFQFYHLLPELTALENVLLPMMIGKGPLGWMVSRGQMVSRAKALLDRVGLGHRIEHKPRELSGGEMQRTALARALITKPRLLLADEPTGNLDDESGAEVIRLLRTLNREEGLTILMVTHNLEITRDTDRLVRLSKGLVVDEELQPAA